MDKFIQPEVNIGLIGHVDHGKTTLIERLSGKWTDTHSEELKRGITIKLGYADVTFYKCPKCKDAESYTAHKKCPKCESTCKPLRKVSFIDAPGHETLMATMLSGAAIMDGALLLVAANEKCPQPQTKEHLMALSLMGINNIVIVQNKIDLIDEKTALENYKQIKEFVKGTIAENAPIIPLSAQHNININILIEAIEEVIKTPQRDLSKNPIMYIARSFDINKPGSKIEDIVGGVLGGALMQGKLKVKDKIELKPGIKIEKEGKEKWEPILAEITDLKTGGISVKEIVPGGSIGVLTKLDPSIVKSNNLVGNVVGHPDKLPEVLDKLTLKLSLLENVIGTKENIPVDPIKKGEILLLNVNSTATVGVVIGLSKDAIEVRLKLPVCAEEKSKVAISRRVGTRWRLIGVGTIEK
ncbi:translation initiation factor IF-2 subunit gamma [archaeon]|nr:translation initiation factor IF-2 subunit gamma [archaeon]|tara:strand:- start:5002 stop:6237 length:1236 start_codon:yes stop_codon:yes gene_type:complete